MKKSWLMLSIVLLLGLLLIGCTPKDQAQPDNPPANPPAETDNPPQTGNYDAASAETSYKQTCASCHGANMEGVVGPSLNNIGSKYSKDQIKNIIVNGQNAMPGGLVSEDVAENLAAWLADKK
ncbi:cytochrome c [Microaerobacter geothermalis]|uniref:c-type cytochrome n=1 Tax=Microaerobacter geothermalis TaxID=674972 RepID=UPI001F358E7D|nr:cytochrome c [Microaerobacter geothermalis]MCF6093442.1 cytochrome c [Microaerobacter geothermalis]